MSHNFNDQINLLDFEKNFNCPVAGVDEVGRGPLAGPVVAAAVILDKNNLPEGIRDSKKISKILFDNGIICSLRNGFIRISLAHYNDQTDIDKLLSVLEKL